MGFPATNPTPNQLLTFGLADEHFLADRKLDLERLATDRLDRHPRFRSHRGETLLQPGRHPKREHDRLFDAGRMVGQNETSSRRSERQSNCQTCELLADHRTSRVDRCMHRSSALEGSRNTTSYTLTQGRPAMPKPRTTALVAALALTLAACGGGSESADTTGQATTTIERTPVTTEPPISEPSTPDTTPAPPPTEPSTTTTEPAPTTTEPSVEDQVRAAAFDAYDVYWQCLRAPAACDPSAANLPGSDAFNAQTRTLDDLVEGGLYVGDEDVGYMVIESIEIKDDHTLVTSCWRLTAVLYFQPPIDGQPPTVQNDREGWGRQTDEFVQDPDDDVWKIRRSDVGEQGVDSNECPPEES